MAIPSSVSVHSVAFHGFVSEDGIFHRWSDSMPEMRSPWRKRRSIVGDGFEFLGSFFNRSLENLIIFSILVETLYQFTLFHIWAIKR
jgi:hypothetical protein